MQLFIMEKLKFLSSWDDAPEDAGFIIKKNDDALPSSIRTAWKFVYEEMMKELQKGVLSRGPAEYPALIKGAAA